MDLNYLCASSNFDFQMNLMTKKLLFTLSVLTFPITLCAQTTNGLVAHFSFNDGTVTDEVGTNISSSVGVSTTPDRFGNDNKAFRFNGSSYIILGKESSLKQSAATVSLWVKNDPANTNQNLNTLLFARNTANTQYISGYHLLFWSNEKKPKLYIDMPSGSSLGIASNSEIDTNWHHLAFSYDHDTMYLYVDGVFQQKSTKYFTSNFSVTDSVYLGALNYGGLQNFFYGSLDDVRFYDRVLSQTEIEGLFNEENPVSSTANIYEQTASNLRVFPNPASNQICIDVSENTTITVSTIWGKTVLTTELTNQKNTLDVVHLPSGVYFIQSTNGVKTAFVKE